METRTKSDNVNRYEIQCQVVGSLERIAYHGDNHEVIMGNEEDGEGGVIPAHCGIEARMIAWPLVYFDMNA